MSDHVDFLSLSLAFLMIFCLWYFVLRPRLKGRMIPMKGFPKKNQHPFPSINGPFFDDYVRGYPYIYVLDARSEAESKKECFKDMNNIIVLFIPMETPGFFGQIISDSRFHDMLGSTKEIVVIANDDSEGIEVCYALVEFGTRMKYEFTPVHLEEGIKDLPPHFIRFNARKSPSAVPITLKNPEPD